MMKRILSLFLVLFLLVALLAMPVWAADSITTSVTLNGVTQSVVGGDPTGYSFYNGYKFLNPPAEYIDSHPYIYFFVMDSGSTGRLHMSNVPLHFEKDHDVTGAKLGHYYVLESEVDGVAPECLTFSVVYLKEGISFATEYYEIVYTTSFVSTYTSTVFRSVNHSYGTKYPYFQYASHDVLNLATGEVVWEAGTRVEETTDSFTSTIPPYEKTGSDRYSVASGSSDVVSLTSSGMKEIVYQVTSPYVDLCLSESLVARDRLIISGDLMSQLFIGLKFVDTGQNSTLYYKADLYPNSVQILVNGSLVGNAIEFEPEYEQIGYAPYGGVGFGDTYVEHTFEDFVIEFPESIDITSYGVRISLSNMLGLNSVSMDVEAPEAFEASAYMLMNTPLFPTFTFEGSADPEPSPDPEPSETVDPDPEPTETTDPDPEPTETTDPDPEPTETTDPNPDPEPTETTDPDPEPTETTDPDPDPTPSEPVEFDPSGMGILAAVITGAVNLLKIEISILGFTFSLWEMLLFDMIAGVILYLVWRFLL